jgi:hypothetical protein
MKVKSTILLLYIAWLIAAVMLVFAAAQKQPDNFYTLLRWICCAVFAYSAVTSFRMKRVLWLWIFAALAVLFNPIFLSFGIAACGSRPIGFQSARWLLPPVSFGKLQKTDQICAFRAIARRRRACDSKGFPLVGASGLPALFRSTGEQSSLDTRQSKVRLTRQSNQELSNRIFSAGKRTFSPFASPVIHRVTDDLLALYCPTDS